ncbi:J domain-containing protein [Thiotrichales bacterium 19S3-7]|nr:J domain-containing protein [Thiotrichales bacterium 19S3-7]MCF6802264.1 J domain-containing protein [Thiotrichales bacterium 19S3-11]
MNKFEAALILGLQGKVTASDIKKSYRLKVKEFHPDRNPAGIEMMKVINCAYEILKDIEEIEVFENIQMTEYPEILNTALNAVKNLTGIVIEICGLWVWLSGETKAHKEIIKQAGFKWARKKQMWFYRPEQAKGKKHRNNNQEWSMEEIREKFNSTKMNENKNYLEAI